MANTERYTNWDSASRRLGSKDRVPIGYATELVRGEDDTIAVAHHGSGIVFMTPDQGHLAYQITMAGWDSNTTRERISQYVRARFSGNVRLSRIDGQTALSVRCGEWNDRKWHSLEIDTYGTYGLYRETWDGCEVLRVTSWDRHGYNVYRLRMW